MSFGSFFGKVGRVIVSPTTAKDGVIVGGILAAANPALGALVQTIAMMVYQVEMAARASKDKVSGSDKKDTVKAFVDTCAPVILQMLQQISGKPVDAAAVAPAIDKLIDDAVELFNVTGIFEHAAAAAPAKS